MKKSSNYRTDLISETIQQDRLNQRENDYVGKNADDQCIGEQPAIGYTFHRLKNTNHINQEMDEIRKMAREDIRQVAPNT